MLLYDLFSILESIICFIHFQPQSKLSYTECLKKILKQVNKKKLCVISVSIVPSVVYIF